MIPTIQQATDTFINYIRAATRDELIAEFTRNTRQNGSSNGHRVMTRARKNAGSERVTTLAKGAKRPPALIAKTVEKLRAHVKAHPGERIEQIGKALGLPTKDLKLPVDKLLASKKIKTRGEKRATRYFPR